LIDEIKRDEMGRACSKYSVKKRCMQGFAGETWGKETIWKTQKTHAKLGR